MSRFARMRRRPDHWRSAHHRARALAAERLDGSLGLAEATWLDEHLGACSACRAVADAYATDQASLRVLREMPLDPPRDLWARTAAAVEGEARLRHGGSDGPSARPAWRLPIGALSGIAVIAVVIGATLLSGRSPFGGPTQVQDPGVAVATTPPPSSSPGPSPVPAATPIIVGAGDVAWIDRGPSGSVGYSAVAVDEVCPQESETACAIVGDSARESVGLTTAPRSVIGSPGGEHAVAISPDGESGDRLMIVQLPDRSTPPTPSPDPTESTAGSPTPEPTLDTLGSPEPTLEAVLAIATDIEVIGESAAFSSDGSWFAFTARPVDGSAGPNVYVWHVGEPTARALTDDGASYFASWTEAGLVASRPAEADAPVSAVASVLVDPETGAETPLGSVWRPIVDPTDTFAIVWAGSLAHPTGADGPWVPADGRLELRTWSAAGPGKEPPAGPERIVTAKASGGYDVRWDETGEWVAVWVADPLDPAIGRLTLYRLDRDDERLERVDGAPVKVPALPGFSIGEGRLAWATPPGQGGEGSRIQIAAWDEDHVGTVESAPGEGLVVIR